METIAIYWEEQVKVYGIMLKSDLRLLHLRLSENSQLPYHSLLTILDKQPTTFELLATTADSSTGSLVSFVVDDEQYEAIVAALREKEDKQPNIERLQNQLVEMIYLHGPHFQERFGILARATEPLHQNSIQTVAVGCAGNSMYIVVPKGQGAHATAILRDTFQTPTAK